MGAPQPSLAPIREKVVKIPSNLEIWGATILLLAFIMFSGITQTGGHAWILVLAGMFIYQGLNNTAP